MAYMLDNIPVEFKDELLTRIENESVLARVIPTTRVDLGDNLLQFGLGLEPAAIMTGTAMSALPGEGDEKPVQGENEFVAARAYKFAQIIPVSAEYMYKLPRLYDAIVENAPKTIALGVDKTAFTSASTIANFATLNDTAETYAQIANVDDPLTATTYDYYVAAFNAVAGAGYIPNVAIVSPAASVGLMTMTAQDGRPVFGTGADGVNRLFGARVEVSPLLNSAITTTTPYAIIGDANAAKLGFVDNIRLKILEEATLKIGDEFVSLAQHNLIGVLVEGWAAFMCAPDAFARIGGAEE